MILFELAQCEHPECIPVELQQQLYREGREWDDLLCDPANFADYAATCWLFAG